MNRDLTQEERDALETLVDDANVGAVLMALSEICGEKAEHVRANWQDGITARAWDEACGRIGVVSTEISHKLHI